MLTVFLLALGGFFAVPASSHASEAVGVDDIAFVQEYGAEQGTEAADKVETGDESEVPEQSDEVAEPVEESETVEEGDSDSGEVSDHDPELGEDESEVSDSNSEGAQTGDSGQELSESVAELDPDEEPAADLESEEGGTVVSGAENIVASAEAVVVEPTVVVTGETAELSRFGDNVVTVRGSGFLPSGTDTSGTRPPFAGKFTGAYVIFGSFAEDWKPSEGVESPARSVAEQKWAVPAGSMATIGGPDRGAVELNEDGSFETELNLKYDVAKELADGNWGIYTYPGGGATYAPFETYTPVTFKPVPTVTVEGVVANLDRDADNVVTVRGSGFLPSGTDTSGTRPPFAGKFTGAYVIFGSFAEDWKPSEGVESPARSVAEQKWAVPAGSMATIGGPDRGAVELNEDGSFETELNLKYDVAKELADGNWGIYTYPGGGATYAPFETYTPVTFKPLPGEEEPSSSAAITLENSTVVQGETVQFVGTGFKPGEEVRGTVYSDPYDLGIQNADQNGKVVFSWNIPADFPAGNHTVELVSGSTQVSLGFVIEESAAQDADVAVGSLLWSFKNTWNWYLSNLAAGTTSVSDGATLASDGTIGYVQVAGGDYDPDTKLGSIHYQGAVVYSSEIHGFEIGMKDPRVEFTSNGATLTALVSNADTSGLNAMTRIALATLDSAQPTEKDGFFTWADVAGVFNTIEQPDGWTDYSGQAIDPVTFSFGSEALEIPAEGSTPPKKVVAEIGSGDGENDSTSAGSAAVKTAQPEQCTARAVTGGSMTWGFLTNYRNYVEGRIAKGNFSGGSFSAVSGALNPKSNGVGIANFAGSIVATGHNGLMNFQLSNPSIQITGPNTATLFASTSTTDMSGNPSVSGRVAYANLSFGSLNISGNSVSVNGASATLTAAGSSMFDEFSERYPAGTALDPVSFSVTLGAEVPCDGSTDPEVLASTGAESPTQALGLAVMALLLGASLVLIGRKKRVTQLS